VNEGEWHRFHPLSPLLRGGVVTVAVIGWILSGQVDRIFGSNPEDPTQGHVGLAAGGFLLVVAVIIGMGWVAWRVSRYRLGATTLELHTGVLFRQHRQVRYDRIQAVDVVRPILARLTGLAEVRVESAGGGDSHVRLAFLGEQAAYELRDELVALAGTGDEERPDGDGASATLAEGADHRTEVQGAVPLPAGRGPDVAPQPAPPAEALAGRPVLRVPNVRLVQSLLYTSTTVFIVVAVPIVLAAFAFRWAGVLSTLGPATLAIGLRHVGQLFRWYNFDLRHTGDVLRARHGLTDLRTSSVPLHRIQAVELSQRFTWRLPGWWRIEVNVAGVGGSEGGSETTVLPVGTLEEAMAVLELILPVVRRETVLAAMHESGPTPGFTTAPRSARWVAPLGWTRMGYAVTPASVVTRSGLLVRRCQVVPHARIQSLTLAEGPVDRRLGLAGVRLVSTPGPVGPGVRFLASADATTLIREQMVRSGRARARRRPTGGTSSDSVAHSQQT
jgi:putative membrane protein